MRTERYTLPAAAVVTIVAFVCLLAVGTTHAQTYTANGNAIIPVGTPPISIGSTTGSTDTNSSTSVNTSGTGVMSIMASGTGTTMSGTGSSTESTGTEEFGTTNTVTPNSTSNTGANVMTNTSATQTMSPVTIAASAPAPEVVNIDAQGNALVRGEAATAGNGTSITLTSWGGTWTIVTNSSTQIAGGGADLSSIPAGHFVGVAGTIDPNMPWTIDATVVRDWTANPATASTAANASVSGDTTSTGSTGGVTSGTAATGTGVSGSGGTSGTGSTNAGTSASNTTSMSTGSSTASGIPAGDTLYTGQVTDVSNASSGALTITDQNGTQYTVNVAPSATIWNSSSATIPLSSIAQGDSIRLDGSLQADGTITADVVRDTSQ